MQVKRIHQLDPLLANQIAAGEVVERPASVVKELLENSLDAGATKIEIEIEGGGRQLIQVRDNGVGLEKADLLLAFSRHATSKISELKDLSAILSLGFRGEALASIASVSRCRLTSQTQDQANAWQIQIGPDLTPTILPSSHPVGTTVEVADLFYNTPVRRKFLRSERSEFQAIDDMVKKVALAYPQVSFQLKHQQKLIRHYPAISALTTQSARVGKICGPQFMEHASPVDMEAVGLKLTGWLGDVAYCHRQADCQYFFVNNRHIKDRLLNHAIKSLYQQHPQMVEGTYPCYVLHLTIDPHEVDVNVHPTKQEVRFSQPRLVHDFISKCVSETIAQTKESQPEINHYSVPCQTPPITKAMPEKEMTAKRYTLLENHEGVILVDLKLAKEPLINLYFKHFEGSIPVKSLLFPLNLSFEISEPDLAKMREWGFHFQKLSLLQQPAFIQKAMTEEQLKLLIKNGNLGQILSLEDLWGLPTEIFSELLLQYASQPQARCWRLTHDQIALCQN